MGLALKYGTGQTRLDEEEKDGLLISTIATHSELNEAEQLNIEEAIEWTMRRRFRKDEILSEGFVRLLHKQMYQGVWRRAGEFRRTNKNIGVDKFQIGAELRQLIDDCRYWMENKSFEADEIAIRFKHKIVSVHCFPNGNGRHSRLIADIIIKHLFDKPIFTWGAKNLRSAGMSRAEYIAALKEADWGNFDRLIRFARN